MITPGAQEILASVVAAVEREIAPVVAHYEYAASLCRTVAQMLRHVSVRVEQEVPALTADNAELRALLEAFADQDRLATVVGALPPAPVARFATRDDLVEEATALRHRLVAVIEATPDEQSPVRQACQGYLGNQLRRQLPWQQDAYTGPRR